jgi:hypothetical protein
MYQDVRALVTDVVKKSNAKGIAKYPKKKTGSTAKQTAALSEKALEAKKAIEEGDFGCQKESVAKLVSAILGEAIVVDCDDDFDPGKVITVPIFSLLVCLHSTSDEEGDDTEAGEEILKIRAAGDVSDFCCTDPFALLKDYTKNHYLSKDGISQYLFDEIYENDFRFATDDEIEKFIKKLPKDAIKFWFEAFVAIFDLALKQSDK